MPDLDLLPCLNTQYGIQASLKVKGKEGRHDKSPFGAPYSYGCLLLKPFLLIKHLRCLARKVKKEGREMVITPGNTAKGNDTSYIKLY